jgi:hypothetical protein
VFHQFLLRRVGAAGVALMFIAAAVVLAKSLS